ANALEPDVSQAASAELSERPGALLRTGAEDDGQLPLDADGGRVGEREGEPGSRHRDRIGVDRVRVVVREPDGPASLEATGRERRVLDGEERVVGQVHPDVPGGERCGRYGGVQVVGNLELAEVRD